MEMLAEGVDLFIAETLEANKSVANDADKHSIALIKFADDSYYSGSDSTQEVSKAVVGNNKQSNGYNYSQVVAPLTTVNETGAATLIAHMDSITPGGATSVDYGLALATQLINEASNSAADRKNVVVGLTVGKYNHSNGYDESVAATCINQAKALKDIGVTIFTICVDENADSSAALTTSNEDINKFMHYLSSNFPNATAGNNNVLDDGVANSEVAEAMGRGFYQTPDTNMSLGSIFEGIAQSIEKPTIEVGESATLVDTISPYFTLPEGTNGISVLTSEKTATGWADPVDVSSSVTVTLQNGRTISVNGFDFDENYVSETPRNGFYGKKLILTFNITPDYDALDTAADAVGEDGKIATNYGDATLYDSSMNAVATAPSPTLQMYKVTYYVDGVLYKTVYRFAGTDVTLIDEPADTAALDYGTWTSEDVTITDDQFKMPAEDVEIHLTSTRKSYKVTYRYSGTVPEDAPALPADEYVYHGVTVNVADEPESKYFEFNGWTSTDATISSGSFTMPAHDVVISGSFTQTNFPYRVNYYVDNNLYESFIVYSGDIHTIIEKPEYPAPITFKGWSEPINASTGKVVPTTDGKFVMPEADVNIYGERNVNMPIDGTVSIEKELEAPAGFNVRYFTFSIYREYGTRLEYIKTVRIKAGEKISISLDPGIYQIVEENAEVEGYTLFTTSDVEGNRVVVKAGRLSSIKFKNSYYENVLVREDHFGYVIGYPDGLVRPEANITRAEVATIFFRMLTDEARAKYWSQTNSFSDVSSSDWFNNAVSTLANAGVLNGYADGTFRPNAYITRAELVKIAVSFFGTSAGQSTHFADASNHWATEFVAAAEEFGFIDGYEDGTFRPDKYVTRAEAMKIINRTLGRNPHKNQLLPGMITWADNTADKWYYADVQEATNSHIYIWDDFGYEIWEAILPVRDWAALEKEWSTANAD